ncbi:peptidoglycan/xylan/chitin deacetylase (PgdA/CDA1 family) [Paenibacillus mucilaginosus]|uniref:polysaccharide deacetylase family protein n=1 Tax=Paenibacillus mucilaginosus TaxID=61624 RepID=UPI003D1E4C12
MKRIISLCIALFILISPLPIVSQTASAAPSAPYVVNYSSSNNLSASNDSTVVPGSTGVASQRFVVSGSGWNGAFYTDWGTHDVSAYNTLDFWVKGGAGGEALSMNVSDGTNSYTANIQTPSDASWKHVSIDFSAMTGVDFTKWKTITFTSNSSTVNTTFYMNNVQFSYLDPYTGPQVTVVPWNGAQSAVSLTFDDGVDSQLDYAVPALNAKGMKATFFITETAITGSRKEDWKKLPLAGHEIGNHSKHHYEPSANPTQPYQRTYDDTLGYDETVAAQTEIAQAMGTPVVTYAYPYTNNDPYLVKYLKDTHLSARGGWGNGTYYMNPSDTPDWMNISSRFTWEEGSFNTDYKSWVDNAISQGAWTVITAHDVGGTATSLPLDQMNLLINYLDTKRSSIWIAPYGTVSGYWRAQKTIENLTPNATLTGTSYNWNVPAYFPNNINLKVKLKNGDGYQVVQNGQVIQPDAGGNYTISFGAKSLELKRKPYAVNYSNSNNLTASTDAAVVPGNTGVASQKFVYAGSGWNGAFYTNDWASHDVSAYNTLDFWVKAGAGGVTLSMYVSDGTNGYSVNIQTPSDASWKHVSIPLATMTGVNFTKWKTITVTSVTNPATFYMNNVQFSRT